MCGTTGEGVLLSLDERRAVAGAFRAALNGVLVVHAGAQTTRDTVALAAHAAEIEADAVAVIAPPYFPLDADALTAHFVAAARACAPPRSTATHSRRGPATRCRWRSSRRIADQADNLAGLKVSESPFERVAPYLELGLPVLIGNEPLIPDGLAAGAIGSVSGMAAAVPEVVRAAVDDPSPQAGERLARLRAALRGLRPVHRRRQARARHARRPGGPGRAGAAAAPHRGRIRGARGRHRAAAAGGRPGLTSSRRGYLSRRSGE